MAVSNKLLIEATITYKTNYIKARSDTARRRTVAVRCRPSTHSYASR